VANPWTDPERAQAWTPHGKPGNALRPLQLEILLTVAEALAPRRILDLGCGPGEIDALMLERLPAAEVICLDESPVMLERAREVLAPFAGRTRFVESDLGHDWRAAAGVAFDLVFASQAVHHVVAPGKRVLYARVHAALAPGGSLLLNDKVAFDGRLFPIMVALWNRVRAETGFEPVAADLEFGAWQEAEILGGDVPDSVDEHLAWLRAAGFSPVDCLWRHADQAILLARKEA
jgi:tRNA (cmo5U34)-methyltransferase